MVRVFQTLAQERQLRRAMGNFTVVSAAAYAPKQIDADFIKDSDVPWLERFAADGGKIVISGDVDMLDSPHELLALQQKGFVVVFFERKWSQWDFFRKSSLLLHYWRILSRRIRAAKPGTLLRIPGHWREDGDLQDVSPKRQQITKEAPAAADDAGGKVSSGRKGTRVRRKRSGVRQEAGEGGTRTAEGGEAPLKDQLDLDLVPSKPGP